MSDISHLGIQRKSLLSLFSLEIVKIFDSRLS
jgi:hypothetical protein